MDKLTFSLNTDGSISPKDAMVEGSKLVKAFFERLVLWNVPEDITEEELEEVEDTEALKKEKLAVDDLPLPTRTVNALKKADIDNLSELAEKTEEELLDIKNIGKKSIEEISKLLEEENLK